jgi:integrase
VGARAPLAPVVRDRRLDRITEEEIDRYRVAKLREGRLAPNSVNKTIVKLASILELAREYRLIAHNPARGRRRLAKASEPRRTWIEVEQLPSLLDAADAYMRPIVSIMAGAGGLRVGEAVALDCRDLNLATAMLIVREAKTVAGEGREVDLPGGVLADVTQWQRLHPGVGKAPLFVSRRRNGKHSRQTVRNVEARFKTVIADANVRLAELGLEPISELATPHSLGRTYASLRAALRDDPSTSPSRWATATPVSPSASTSGRRSGGSDSQAPISSSSTEPANGRGLGRRMGRIRVRGPKWGRRPHRRESPETQSGS